MNHVLIAFGFCWMIVAALLGFYVGAIHDRHVETLEHVAGQGKLLDYHRRLDTFKWKVTVHAHSFLFGVVAILVGLSMPVMGYSSSAASVLAYVLMAAPVIWAAGGWRRFMPLMGIGDVLLLAGIAGAAYGLTLAS